MISPMFIASLLFFGGNQAADSTDFPARLLAAIETAPSGPEQRAWMRDVLYPIFEDSPTSAIRAAVQSWPEDKFYLHQSLATVIGHTATDSDKEFLVQNLWTHPSLMLSVYMKGWHCDYQDEITGFFEEHYRELPTWWLMAVVDFRDPSSYPTLLEFLEMGRTPATSTRYLSELGIPLRESVERAWEIVSQDSERRLSFALTAAYYGVREALDVSCTELGEMFINKAFDVPTPENPEAWYAEHKHKITYVGEGRGWVLHIK